jgi:glycosyltransferase involved in cell wall biosynthesis
MVVVGGDGPLVSRLEKAGIQVEIRALPASLGGIRQDRIGRLTPWSPVRLAALSTYILRLAQSFKHHRVALVHANSLRACVLGGLAGRLAGVPVVWQVHSVVSKPMMSNAAIGLIRSLARWLPERIICNSRATAACFGGPSERVRVIACGVDSTVYAANGRTAKPGRVGMISRFSPLKGQHVFVEAARLVSMQHPNVEFLLAGAPLFGEDGYARRVREEAEKSVNHDRIHFLGFVDDVPALLHDLDIVVQPSTLPEGFGQAVLEAMMAGKPVIASAAGGTVDLVEDGVTGRLVPAGDAQAVASAIDAFLRDPAAARAMGERARERALERYEIHETAAATARVYQEVLGGA